MIHPEAIEAVHEIYAAYQKGEDIRWVDSINRAVDKAKGLNRAETCNPLDRIFLAVCCHFNQKPSDVRGRSRKRELVWPRMLAQFLMKESGEKMAVIDRYFGATTRGASHNVDSVREYIQHGKDRQDYLALKQQLGL